MFHVKVEVTKKNGAYRSEERCLSDSKNTFDSTKAKVLKHCSCFSQYPCFLTILVGQNYEI